MVWNRKQKYVPLVKKNVMKLEVLGGQRIDQKRKKGWWREKREDWEREQREDSDREKRDKRELSQQLEEEDKEHRHLPLLVVPQGIAFFLSSRLYSAVKRCSSEVLVAGGAAWKGSGPKRLLKYWSGVR